MFRTRAIIAVAFCAAILTGTPTQADPAEQRYIVKFKQGAAPAATAALNSAGAGIARRLDPQNAAAAHIPDAALAGLRNNPNIEYIEPDPLRYPMAGTQIVPYGIKLVEANQVSDVNAGNRTVCIIDSGYSLGHEDLPGNNVVTGTSDPSGAGNWDVDNFGHGTHVAGTLAAFSNTVGVLGTLPSGYAKLHIVKVFDDAGDFTYSSDLINALNVCTSPPVDANIVNMSLGCSGSGCYSLTEEIAFIGAYADGVLSVAAAGNGGNTAYSYPASYDSVISVAGVDSAMGHYTSSQRNDQVELAAPGLIVRSTVQSGTGMEESVVAGNVAYEAKAMVGSPDLSATGELADCGIAETACQSVTGKICLIKRDQTTLFANSVLNCEAGNGIGAVIYNDRPGLIWGTLAGTPTTIPSVGVSDTDGPGLVARLGQTVTVNTTAGGNYSYFNGTSMATPHVAGVAALIWSHDPSATNQDVRDALVATAMDLGDAGKDDYFGWGLIQAKAALDCLTGVTSGCVAPNAPPSAAFDVSCTGLDCYFDATDSSDTGGGTIVDYSWDFGDGNSGNGMTAWHTYATGSYTATLTVTDDAGATDETYQTVSVPAITLSVSGYKKKGKHKADLSWAGTDPVDIYRGDNGAAPTLRWTEQGGGEYTDHINTKGRGYSYTYRVCAPGQPAVCSPDRRIVF